jgi:outer membrane protein assembly factor BamB
LGAEPENKNDSTESSPAIGSDGTVYIGSLDGYLYAITSAGALKWSFPVSGQLDEIKGTGGWVKGRAASPSRNMGKSGGFRFMTIERNWI